MNTPDLVGASAHVSADYMGIYLPDRLHNELHAIRDVVPSVLNGLPSDVLYPENEGSTPDTVGEAVQNWEAIGAMIARCSHQSVETSLAACEQSLDTAEALYAEVAIKVPLRIDQRSNADHIPAIRAELQEFAQLAEI